MSINTRKMAVNLLVDIIENGKSLSESIKVADESENTALVKQYCFGVCRWYFQINTYLEQLLKKPLKEKNKELKILILLGIYEIAHMSTAEHAVVNECVNTAVKMKHEWAKGLVNGVLRNFIRKKDSLIDKTNAHPEWMITAFKKHWPSFFNQIIEVNNSHPPMFLRVNVKSNSADNYIEKYNLDAETIEGYPNAIRLRTPCPVSKLPGFDKGLVSVQDCSAQLSAYFLDLKANMRILDACAAPGGKTCHILETEPEIKELVAIDIEQRRTDLIKENLDRLHLSATLITDDATNADSWWDQKSFDRILIDAPCSATGVIRRNPDIKIHRQPADIPSLNKQQLKLLTKLWPVLKEGGVLLYATCSILPEENTDIIERFLNNIDDAIEIKIEHPDAIEMKFGIQFLPNLEKGDGFYYCALRKE